MIVLLFYMVGLVLFFLIEWSFLMEAVAACAPGEALSRSHDEFDLGLCMAFRC